MPARSWKPAARDLASIGVHKVWRWIQVGGAISPTSAKGKRFRSMGYQSCIAFPPGGLYGEHWITIGDETLIGARVSMAVGLPTETLDPAAPAVIRIGDRCNIGAGSSLVGRCGIDIGDDVTTGPNVYITDHNHRYADIDIPISQQWVDEAPVRIGAGSWLAANVVVLPGAEIGRNVTVAAGAVVRGVVPDHCVIAGSPARVVRQHHPATGWDPPLHPDRARPPEGWPGG